MDKKFSGKIWKFGNDIDTDTIIPGKRGTIPTIEEMKKYAFELLKPEFGSTCSGRRYFGSGYQFWVWFLAVNRRLRYCPIMVFVALLLKALPEFSSAMLLTAE